MPVLPHRAVLAIASAVAAGCVGLAVSRPLRLPCTAAAPGSESLDTSEVVTQALAAADLCPGRRRLQPDGVPISVISRWLGRYDGAFTMRAYVHADHLDDLRQGTTALGELYKIEREA